MFQRSGLNTEDIRQLNSVATAAPRPLDEELKAEGTRAELAKGYSNEAIVGTFNSSTLSAQNFISLGEEVIGAQMDRIASLLIGDQEKETDVEQESSIARAALVGAAAEETARYDLDSKLPIRDVERISVTAEREAQSEYSFSSDILARLNADAQKPDESQQPIVSATRSPSTSFGSKVVTINLATSDFPLSEVYGPGFEMLASNVAARSENPSVSRETQSQRDEPVVDFSSADLSALSLGMSGRTVESFIGADTRSFRIEAAQEKTLSVNAGPRATAA